MDGMEGLSQCSTSDQGPDGTEKWGRYPEQAKEEPAIFWRFKGQFEG